MKKEFTTPFFSLAGAIAACAFAGVLSGGLAKPAQAASVQYVNRVVQTNQGGAGMVTGTADSRAITLDGIGYLIFDHSENFFGLGHGADLRVDFIGKPSKTINLYVRPTEFTAQRMGLTDLGGFLPVGEYMGNSIHADLTEVVTRFSQNGPVDNALFDRVLITGGDQTSGLDSIALNHAHDVDTVASIAFDGYAQYARNKADRLPYWHTRGYAPKTLSDPHYYILDGTGDDIRLPYQDYGYVEELYVRPTRATAQAMGLSEHSVYLPAKDYLVSTGFADSDEYRVDFNALVQRFSNQGFIQDATFEDAFIKGGELYFDTSVSSGSGGVNFYDSGTFFELPPTPYRRNLLYHNVRVQISDDTRALYAAYGLSADERVDRVYFEAPPTEYLNYTERPQDFTGSMLMDNEPMTHTWAQEILSDLSREDTDAFTQTLWEGEYLKGRDDPRAYSSLWGLSPTDSSATVDEIEAGKDRVTQVFFREFYAGPLHPVYNRSLSTAKLRTLDGGDWPGLVSNPTEDYIVFDQTDAGTYSLAPGEAFVFDRTLEGQVYFSNAPVHEWVPSIDVSSSGSNLAINAADILGTIVPSNLAVYVQMTPAAGAAMGLDDLSGYLPAGEYRQGQFEINLQQELQRFAPGASIDSSDIQAVMLSIAGFGQHLFDITGLSLISPVDHTIVEIVNLVELLGQYHDEGLGKDVGIYEEVVDLFVESDFIPSDQFIYLESIGQEESNVINTLDRGSDYTPGLEYTLLGFSGTARYTGSGTLIFVEEGSLFETKLYKGEMAYFNDFRGWVYQKSYVNPTPGTAAGGIALLTLLTARRRRRADNAA